MKLFISKIYLCCIYWRFVLYNTIVFTFKGFEQIYLYCIHIGKSMYLIIMHY